MAALLRKFFESLMPEQWCIGCILVAIGGGLWLQTGKASTTEVATVRLEVAAVREQQLGDAAFDNKVEVCRARAEGRPERAYARLLSEALEAYRAKTGRDYPVPDCDDV